jgi:hypothetical protein
MPLVRATTTVHLPDNVTINEGDILDDTEAAVSRCPMFFEPVGSAAARSAEVIDATARPGVKRGAKG